MNQNRFHLTGTPDAGTYTINGTSYTASQVGTFSGNATFGGVAPYVGLGWGDPMDGGRLTLMMNAGAIYEGAANVSLAATGAAASPQLASSLQQARQSLDSRISGYQWWPVMGIGLMYRF